MSIGDFTVSTGVVRGAAGSLVWTGISFAVALLGAIFAYFMFLSPKKEYPNKFVNWVKDFFNFDKMVLEVIIKITYLFLTIFITLISFALIPVSFLGFLFTLIFGNIALRVSYEMIIVLIMIWKNTTDIKKEVTKKSK